MPDARLGARKCLLPGEPVTVQVPVHLAWYGTVVEYTGPNSYGDPCYQIRAADGGVGSAAGNVWWGFIVPDSPLPDIDIHSTIHRLKEIVEILT